MWLFRVGEFLKARTGKRLEAPSPLARRLCVLARSGSTSLNASTGSNGSNGSNGSSFCGNSASSSAASQSPLATSPSSPTPSSLTSDHGLARELASQYALAYLNVPLLAAFSL